MRASHAFLAAIALVGTGTSVWAESLRGIVQSVDADAKKMIVKEVGTGVDRNVDLATNDATVIRTNKGVPMSFRYLRKGDGVGVVYADGVASQILVRQSPLVGVIVKAEPDDEAFVMTPKGEDEDMRVTTTKKTTYETFDGKVLKLAELKPGDGVSVRFNGPDVAKVVIGVKPPELTGYVKSVAADLNSIIVTEVGTNVDSSVRIDGDTTIRTSDDKPLTIKQLKKGDGVGIAVIKGVAEEIVVNVKQP